MADENKKGIRKREGIYFLEKTFHTKQGINFKVDGEFYKITCDGNVEVVGHCRNLNNGDIIKLIKSVNKLDILEQEIVEGLKKAGITAIVHERIIENGVEMWIPCGCDGYGNKVRLNGLNDIKPWYLELGKEYRVGNFMYEDERYRFDGDRVINRDGNEIAGWLLTEMIGARKEIEKCGLGKEEEEIIKSVRSWGVNRIWGEIGDNGDRCVVWKSGNMENYKWVYGVKIDGYWELEDVNGVDRLIKYEVDESIGAMINGSNVSKMQKGWSIEMLK